MADTGRRTFLKQTGLAGAAVVVAPSILRAAKVIKERPRIAFMGVGGRGRSHVGWVAGQKADCVCWAEVDGRQTGRVKKKFPKAKGYVDYRKMLEEMGDQIDAVFIATPDHQHYAMAMAAMKKNIAVYVEKPLTWSPWESRQLAIEATKRKLPSQMGNQGHAGQGWRVVIGWIRGGAIGDVKEVHTWTNRPVWPQGMKRPDWTTPIPEGLDWDKWIGPAPMRPFADYDKKQGWSGKACYAPKAWRGWYDFGAGALGDMACHTMDGMFWAMNPGHPTKVTLTKISQHMPESFPSESIVRWDFPATKERPGFVQYWYDGTKKLMNRPKGLEGLTQEEVNKVGSGCVFVGTKGSIRVWGDYGNSPRIVQPELMRSVGKPDPKLMPEKSPGHQMEFLLAVKGEKPWDFPKSNFAYAGPMTETILLGTIVQKLGKVGQELNYDGKAMKFTNSKEATAMMKRTPRTGW